MPYTANSDNSSMDSDSSTETESISSPSSSNSLSGFESDASSERDTSCSDTSSSSSAHSSDEENTRGSSAFLEATNGSGYETNEKLELPLLNRRKQRARLTHKMKRDNGEEEEGDEKAEEDNDLECSLCMQNCEMSGEHRLCSLKCGHFFGESCIRIRLKEAACPECKTKARQRHIRYLYAKRLKVIDRSDEERIREQLKQERIRTQILEFELDSMKVFYADLMQTMHKLETDNAAIKQSVTHKDSGENIYNINETSATNDNSYGLVLDRKIAISRKPCCRVMKYADKQTKLIVSQKGFFPGYGLRLMNAPSFESSNYLYTSQKMVCDLSLSEEQNLIAVASKERSAKLFDLRNYQAVTVFKPGKMTILSCAISSCHGNENELFLGSHQGCIYVYDIRNPGNYRQEHKLSGDTSPVIQIEIVKESRQFPSGGFLICQKSSLWFYEIQHTHASGVQATCLMSQENIITIDYNKETQQILLQLGSSLNQPHMRHIMGNLLRHGDNPPSLQIVYVFYAKTSSSIMSRSTQINFNNNTIVAAYIQDQKLLSLFDTTSNSSNQLTIQSYPVTKVIYDLCPIYVNEDFTYLAALNKSKCFIYKLNKTGSVQ
ncbi:E3 ubiquitin-protein ligase RFWD3-like [Musca vetustissima]|uniref:E3 ubiquitin-protein ligase RFWD3-like n=1 Tax=Musca vetustissima TaxID=27455 RepID=UPI002AB77657|nr:E3 ubiquitin-protein ligase RFWD3-like [Musca vetustissima]